MLLRQNMFADNLDVLVERVVGSGFGGPQPATDNLGGLLDRKERTRLLEALAETDGDRSLAAGLLGISEATLWRKLKKYGISVRKR